MGYLSPALERERVNEPPAENEYLYGSNTFRFLSQTDVVRFLVQHVDELGPLIGRSVEDLGLVDRRMPPLAIHASAPVLKALELMQRAGNFRAVPVVDGEEESESGSESEEERERDWERERRRGKGKVDRELLSGWKRGGRVMGSLSVSDLRGMTGDTVVQLAKLSVSKQLVFLFFLCTLSDPLQYFFGCFFKKAYKSKGW